jgi:hypothetical protein
MEKMVKKLILLNEINKMGLKQASTLGKGSENKRA